VIHLSVELQSVVDIHEQPFVIVDDGHRAVVVNKAFEEAYGVRNAEAAGRPCFELIPRGGSPCTCGSQGSDCPFAEVFAHQNARTTARALRDAKGREQLVRMHGHPIRAQSGGVYLGLLIERDLIEGHPERPQADCPRGRMVGESPAYREALDRLALAAACDAPVLLQGQTGTGKELAAAFIHRHSARRGGPFQTLDCTTLSAELFESEVLGHERGAFTGSIRDKPGLFELADKGTLFLDEIGELPPPLQVKLLRLLETGEFRRVGGTKTRRADVRLICATNRELRGAGHFRDDLYYRIACATVRLPSLAERRSDLPLLVAEILERIGDSSGHRYNIEPAALRRLADYDFPGNIRELRNVLWLASVNAPNGRITLRQIGMAIPGSNGQPQEAPPRPRELAPKTTSRGRRIQGPHRTWSRDQLVSVLRRHSGNRRAAADELGVSERTVYRKLRELGLQLWAIGVLVQLAEGVMESLALPLLA